MPPASLSTLAVIKPGPTTAKNSRIRTFQLFRNFMRAGHGAIKLAKQNDQNKCIKRCLDRRICKTKKVFAGNCEGASDIVETGASAVSTARRTTTTASVSYTHLTLPTKRIV